MYDIILKWGLETVSNVFRDKDPNHLQVTIEAMKMRNTLVAKRFEFAIESAESLADLAVDVEEDLRVFRDAQNHPEMNDPLKRDEYITRLGSEFHPIRMRQFKLLRSKFDATNDLFSAYSLELGMALQWENVKRVLQASAISVSDVNRSYRGLWMMTSEIMMSLIRVTSTDLRFWLFDCSYLGYARHQANIDRKSMEAVMTSGDNETWAISLEAPNGVKSFWSAIPPCEGIQPGPDPSPGAGDRGCRLAKFFRL